MKKILFLVIGLMIVLLVGCEGPESSNPAGDRLDDAPLYSVDPEASLSQLYHQAKQALFSARPMSASKLALPIEDVGQYYADQMDVYSLQDEKRLRDKLTKLSHAITQYSLTEPSPQALENQRVMSLVTRYFAGAPKISVGYIDPWMGLSPFVLNQINGPLIEIPRLLQHNHDIDNENDARDYLARLGKLDQLVASVRQKFEADMNQGWQPPKAILQSSLLYLNGFIAPAPESHPLVVSFIEKLDQHEDIKFEQKQAFIAQATQVMSEIAYPAFQMMIDELPKWVLKAREEAGIWAQPGGEQFYRDAIAQLADSDLPPQAIHQIGTTEVNRIIIEMDRLLKAQGYVKGSVGERMTGLAHEKRFLYADSEQGRSALIEQLNQYIVDISTKVKPIFNSQSPYEVEVKAFPVEVQEGAPGGQYTSPSVNASRPGIYWINLRDMHAVPKFGLKTLTYHEAIPGHHWQISLNLAQQALPLLRRIAPFNAYTEGWALYSEQVVAELGIYAEDPFGDLGRLQAELFRAVRLVVDTGIHHRRWTRQQAIDYMVATTGSTVSDVTAEVERYMVWPAQALGYKLGMLKILSLRETAQKTLATDFDLAEFHDLILLGGSVPLNILEQRVEQWIAQKMKHRSLVSSITQQ